MEGRRTTALSDLPLETHTSVDKVKIGARVRLHPSGIRNVLKAIANQPRASRPVFEPDPEAGLVDEIKRRRPYRDRLSGKNHAATGFCERPNAVLGDWREVPAHVEGRSSDAKDPRRLVNDRQRRNLEQELELPCQRSGATLMGHDPAKLQRPHPDAAVGMSTKPCHRQRHPDDPAYLDAAFLKEPAGTGRSRRAALRVRGPAREEKHDEGGSAQSLAAPSPNRPHAAILSTFSR